MGSLTNFALAIIFTAVITGLFMSGIEAQSQDENKTTFTIYTQKYSTTDSMLTAGNVSYQNQNNTIQNFNTIVTNMEKKISEVTYGFTTGDPVTILASAFGLVQAFLVGVLMFVLAVLIEGLNLVYGVGTSLTNLPEPWRLIGVTFVGLGGIAMLTYVVFSLVRAHKVGDTI